MLKTLVCCLEIPTRFSTLQWFLASCVLHLSSTLAAANPSTQPRAGSLVCWVEVSVVMRRDLGQQMGNNGFYVLHVSDAACLE